MFKKLILNKNLFIFLACIIILLLAALFYKSYLVKSFRHDLISRQEKLTQTYFPLYWEDMQILSRYTLSQNFTANRDAGPLFNPKLVWKLYITSKNVDEQNLKTWEKALNNILDTYQQGQSLEMKIPDDLQQKIERWAGKWVSHSHEIEQYALDFSWMSQLMDFDHWDIDLGTPRQTFFQKIMTISDAYLPLIQAPLPDYNILLKWGQLRLMEGIRLKDIPQSFTEVQHFAHLIASQHNFKALAVASQLNNKMTYLYSQLTENLKNQISLPQDFNYATAVFLDNLGGDYFHLLTPKNIIDNVFSLEFPLYGRCAILRERIFATNGQIPLNLKIFPKEYFQWEDIINRHKKSCRLEGVLDYREITAPLLPPYLKKFYYQQWSKWKYISLIPSFLKSFLWENDINLPLYWGLQQSNTQQQYFDLYKQKYDQGFGLWENLKCLENFGEACKLKASKLYKDKKTLSAKFFYLKGLFHFHELMTSLAHEKENINKDLFVQEAYSNLAQLYYLEPFSKYLAQSLATKSCSLKDPNSCFLLVRLAHDAGQTQLAFERLPESCQAGHAFSCSILGGLLNEQGDIQQSYHYYAQACDYKFSLACLIRGAYAEEEQNRKDAQFYFKKACDLQEKRGCQKLDKIPPQ